VNYAALLRTARLLMRGDIFVALGGVARRMIIDCHGHYTTATGVPQRLAKGAGRRVRSGRIGTGLPDDLGRTRSPRASSRINCGYFMSAVPT